MYQVKVREILVVFVEYNYSSRETLFKTKSGKSNACFSYFLLHRRVLESVWTRAQERALTLLSFKRVCFTFCFDIRATLSAFVYCSLASFGVSFVSFFFFVVFRSTKTKGERVRRIRFRNLPTTEKRTFPAKNRSNKIEKFALGIVITTHIKLE